MLIRYVVYLPIIYGNFADINSHYNAFQLKNGRAVKHQLQVDIQNKEMALGIDGVCHQMNVSSRGLQYYGGIEKYNPR